MNPWKRWGPLGGALLFGITIWCTYLFFGQTAELVMVVGLGIGATWMGLVAIETQKWAIKKNQRRKDAREFN